MEVFVTLTTAISVTWEGRKPNCSRFNREWNNRVSKILGCPTPNFWHKNNYFKNSDFAAQIVRTLLYLSMLLYLYKYNI